MVASDIERLVSDTTNFFHRSTDWSPDGGYFILDTHCTKAMQQLRRKALEFHLDGGGNQRQDIGSVNQVLKTNLGMSQDSDSIAHFEVVLENLDVASHE